MKIRREKVFFLIVSLFFILLVLRYADDSKSSPENSATNLSNQGLQNENFVLASSQGDSYPNAPNPDNDPKQWAQNRKLWPDIKNNIDEAAVEQRVKEEWASFAAKYPNNLYLPNEFKPTKNPKELQVWRETLDTITDVESQIARLRAQADRQEPGQQPLSTSVPDIDIEKQQVYLSYQVDELTSRIELLEFYLESPEIDKDQYAETEDEILRLGAEKDDLLQALSTGNSGEGNEFENSL